MLSQTNSASQKKGGNLRQVKKNIAERKAFQAVDGNFTVLIIPMKDQLS